MKFSPELAAFIGKKVGTRAEALKIVLDYVKEKKLQDPDDNEQFIFPDKRCPGSLVLDENVSRRHLSRRALLPISMGVLQKMPKNLSNVMKEGMDQLGKIVLALHLKSHNPKKSPKR